jgi:hypothetical protein
MERKLLWDYTGDPIRYYNEWIVRKEFSRFTDMIVNLRVIGHVYKTKNEGDFSMEIYGRLENTFDPSNWFTKYIWLIYNYTFYNKLREKYTLMCRDYISSFLNWAKEKYGLRTAITAEAETKMFEEEMEKEGE